MFIDSMALKYISDSRICHFWLEITKIFSRTIKNFLIKKSKIIIKK
jgi:hypothetical protein